MDRVFRFETWTTELMNSSLRILRLEADPAGTPLFGGGECILLLITDLAARKMAHRVLKNCGYLVLEAATAREALETWAGCGAKVDLLVTDVVLPDATTGYDLAGQLRAQQSDLKVIFISACAEDVKRETENLWHQRGNGFLCKLRSSPDLLHLVRRCLGRKT